MKKMNMKRMKTSPVSRPLLALALGLVVIPVWLAPPAAGQNRRPIIVQTNAAGATTCTSSIRPRMTLWRKSPA